MFSASCRGCGRRAPTCTVHRAAGRRRLVGRGCVVFQFDTYSRARSAVAVSARAPRAGLFSARAEGAGDVLPRAPCTGC
eukprot:5629155-Prymnesium_polylepis.1